MPAPARIVVIDSARKERTAEEMPVMEVAMMESTAAAGEARAAAKRPSAGAEPCATADVYSAEASAAAETSATTPAAEAGATTPAAEASATATDGSMTAATTATTVPLRQRGARNHQCRDHRDKCYFCAHIVLRGSSPC